MEGLDAGQEVVILRLAHLIRPHEVQEPLGDLRWHRSDPGIGRWIGIPPMEPLHYGIVELSPSGPAAGGARGAELGCLLLKNFEKGESIPAEG